jgi:hypothetical protein
MAKATKIKKMKKAINREVLKNDRDKY